MLPRAHARAGDHSQREGLRDAIVNQIGRADPSAIVYADFDADGLGDLTALAARVRSLLTGGNRPSTGQ